jgi:CubicO group peptidase (beta-lactamase class C family)
MKDNFQKVDGCLARMTERGAVCGAGALIIRHGGEVYRKSFGVSDAETGTPLENSAIYRIYSMSKTFTAVTAMTLYERGLFKLSDPVAEFLPAYRDMLTAETDARGVVNLVQARRPITFDHLFTMMSGIPYPGGDTAGARVFLDIHRQMEADALKGEFWTTARLVDAAAKAPLCFHPGEGWLYGFSHDVLGRLIEIISGKPLGAYMREAVFEPLGMKDTAFSLAPEKCARLVKPYDYSGGAPIEIGELAFSPDANPGSRRRFDPPNYVLDYGRQALAASPPFESGGAGLLSTLEDVGIYANMLLHSGKLGNTRILSRKTVELIRGNRVPPALMKKYCFPHMYGYGYGLGVRTMQDMAAAGLNSSMGEWAWDGALGTWYGIDPVEDLAAVFLIQRMPGAHDDLCRRFAQAVYASLDD